MNAPGWDTKTPGKPEPVVIGNILNTAMAAIVVALWAFAPADVLTIVVTVVGAISTAISTYGTRAQVTPLDNPSTRDGAPLIPAGQAPEE